MSIQYVFLCTLYALEDGVPFITVMWNLNNFLVFAVVVGIPFISAPSYGQAGILDGEVEARVNFEVALQALEGDETHLALSILHVLTDSAPDDMPEAQVYEAVTARAEGRVAAAEEAVLRILADTPPGEFTYPWVYDELVRWGAEIRLVEMKKRASADLEALLARHYEARGGHDRLGSLDDLVVTGRMTVADREVPFRLCRKRPRFYRLDLATSGGIRTTACDGQVAWRFNSANDSGRAEFLSGTQGEDLLSQSNFDDVLIRFRSTGERLFLTGLESIDGADAYRIEVDLPGGGHHSIFLDAESLLEVRRLVWADPTNVQAEITYEYGDIDGLPMAVRQTVTTAAGTVEYLFDEYQFQQPIDVRIFDAASVESVGD